VKLSITEFKKHCTRLLRELPQTREEIIISSHSRILARVTPVTQEGRHPAWGKLAGHTIEVAEDFDEPEGDSHWEAAHH